MSTSGGLGFGSLSGSGSTSGGGPGVQRGLKLTKELPKDGFGKRECWFCIVFARWLVG